MDELIEEIKNICANMGEPERTEAIKEFILKINPSLRPLLHQQHSEPTKFIFKLEPRKFVVNIFNDQGELIKYTQEDGKEMEVENLGKGWIA